MSETENKKTVSPEFVNTVKKYLETDDKLKEHREIIKKLTSDKKEKEDFILNYLQSIEESVIDVRDGKLRRNISKTQAPLKKEQIHKTLTEIVGDSIKAQAMTDQIIKSRPIVERVTLKRTKNKIASQDVIVNEN
jgi:hypothetical protein